MRARWLLGLLLLAGCERKAPGPAECRAFARRVIGLIDARSAENALVRRRLDDLTRSCLVTPYDRSFLRCVELGASAAHCKREFEQRQRSRR